MDSSGRDEGEVRAPDALLRAGALDAVGGAGPVVLGTGVHDAVRDPVTGVIGVPDLRRSTRLVCSAVDDALRAGMRPLVLGGDCAIVPGILAAAATHAPDLRLAFLDGHLDACDGRTSPTGEAADMDLSVLTGRGPAALRTDPIVAAERITAVGFRSDVEPDLRAEDGRLVTEAELADPRVRVIDAAALAARGPDDVAREIAAGTGPLWLHLDVDVLDPRAMPAVSYPQAGGPDLDAVATLIGHLAGPRLLGAHVTCFEADLDPTGDHARAVVELIRRMARPGPLRPPAP